MFGGLRGYRGGSTTRRATPIGCRFLELCGGLGFEDRVFLRRQGGIVLPGYTAVDRVGALDHSSGVIRIVAPGQVWMPVRTARRRTTWRQYCDLIKASGDVLG